LIERSAVCPLCKLDLFEEEVIEDENDEESEPLSPSHSFLSWWSDFSRSTVESSTNNNEPRQIEIPYGNQQSIEERSVLIAAIEATENTTILESTRSWWPFSVESSVPDTEEEMHGNVDENDDNINRSTSRFWNGLFGHMRRQHRRSPTDNGMLTELTEPLVSSIEQRLEEEHQQPDPIEEIAFTTQQEEEVGSVGRSEETNPLINPTT